MKFFLITLLLAVLVLPVISQVYISQSVTSNGAGLSVGYLIHELDQPTDEGGAVKEYFRQLLYDVEISAGYSVPFWATAEPTIWHLVLGNRFQIKRSNITPSIGIAHASYQDLSQEHIAPHYRIIFHKKLEPLFALEGGRDIGRARVYLAGTYCNKFYGGVGIRAFFK